MLILGIDTATAAASVALADEERTIYEVFVNSGLKHSQTLLVMIDAALKQTELSLERLEGIAVTIGPGSFTGIRIGLATAKGLALARGLKLVGIPTLDALAYHAGWASYLVCPLLNARKGEVYAAFYQGGRSGPIRISDYLALAPDKLAAMAKQLLNQCGSEAVALVGEGAGLVEHVLKEELGEGFVTLPEPLGLPRAASVARSAWERLRQGDVDDPCSLVPIYVRLAEAEARLAAKKGGEGAGS